MGIDSSVEDPRQKIWEEEVHKKRVTNGLELPRDRERRPNAYIANMDEEAIVQIARGEVGIDEVAHVLVHVEPGADADYDERTGFLGLRERLLHHPDSAILLPVYEQLRAAGKLEVQSRIRQSKTGGSAPVWIEA